MMPWFYAMSLLSLAAGSLCFWKAVFLEAWNPCPSRVKEPITVQSDPNAVSTDPEKSIEQLLAAKKALRHPEFPK